MPDLNPWPASRAAYERARRVMPGGNTRCSVFEQPHPLYLVSGSGARVCDLDGREYLDFQNNFTALVHGYNHPETTEALLQQVRRGVSFGAPTESEIELAEILTERVPFFESIRFMNTGSEAVMMAVKAARALTGRRKVAKCEGAYHGNYDPVEVSYDPTPNNWGAECPLAVPYNQGTPQSTLEEVVVLPFNDIRSTERLLDGQKADLACVLIDPLPSRSGLIAVARPYLAFLREYTRRHGIILISDEVLSFRLSYSGGISDYGIEPDLCAFGKIIGGGLPIGAVGGRADVMRVFDPTHGKPAVSQAGTFTANPLSMAAGVAAMRAMTPAAFTQINSLGKYARSSIQTAFDETEVPGQVTGHGSLFRIFFKKSEIKNYRSAYADAEERKKLKVLIDFMRENGVILSSIGLGAISTPMTRLDIDGFAAAFREVLVSMASRAGEVVGAAAR